jgi:hypothetical protein
VASHQMQIAVGHVLLSKAWPHLRPWRYVARKANKRGKNVIIMNWNRLFWGPHSDLSE